MTRKPKGINRPGSGSGWNDDYRVVLTPVIWNEVFRWYVVTGNGDQWNQ